MQNVSLKNPKKPLSHKGIKLIPKPLTKGTTEDKLVKRKKQRRRVGELAREMDIYERRRSAAARLKALRLKYFETATLAAKDMRIKKHTYYEYERGARDIPPKAAANLARFFNVTVEYILEGIGAEDLGERRIETKPALSATPLAASRIVNVFVSTDLDHFAIVQAGGVTLSDNRMVLDDQNGLLPKRMHVFIQTDKSMVQERDPSIIPGAKLFIDPDASCNPGDIVQAVINGQKDSVIRLLTESLQGDVVIQTLKPFNPAYREIIVKPDAGDHILGRVFGQLSPL